MSLEPYPSSLSVEALTNMAGYFRGKTTLPLAVHSAYEVLGFGLSQSLPDPAPSPPAPHAIALATDEHKADFLEGLADDVGGSGAPRAFPIPWAQLVSIVMELINRYFPKA